MPRDYYAEEIEGKPSRDYYAEEIENQIPPSEGFLKRAMSQGLKTAGTTLGQMIPGQDVPFHPFGTVTGQARQMKERGLEGVTSGIKNPFLRFGAQVGLDPETYIGGGKAISEKVPQQLTRGAMRAGSRNLKGTIGAFKDVLNPMKAESEISGVVGKTGSKFKQLYGEGLARISEKFRGKTTSFQDILDSPLTLAEKKVFSSVKDELVHQRIDPSKLSAEESKRVLDIVKDKVGSKIVAGEVGPTEISTEKALSALKKRQLESFPDFSEIDLPYKGIEDFYALEGKTPDLLEGGGNRITRSAKMQRLRRLDKEAFKRTRNYRRVNIIGKTLRNPFVRVIAGSGLAGTALGGLLARKD